MHRIPYFLLILILSVLNANLMCLGFACFALHLQVFPATAESFLTVVETSTLGVERLCSMQPHANEPISLLSSHAFVCTGCWTRWGSFSVLPCSQLYSGKFSSRCEIHRDRENIIRRLDGEAEGKSQQLNNTQMSLISLQEPSIISSRINHIHTIV